MSNVSFEQYNMLNYLDAICMSITSDKYLKKKNTVYPNKTFPSFVIFTINVISLMSYNTNELYIG